MRNAQVWKLTALSTAAFLVGAAVPSLLTIVLRKPAQVAHAPQSATPSNAPVAAPEQNAPAVVEASASDAAPIQVIPAAAGEPSHDLAGVTPALRAYHDGDRVAGDAALATRDPLVRAAVEWVFLRTKPAEAGLTRHRDFLNAHPDWPSAALRRHAEELAGAEDINPERARAYLAAYPSTGPVGDLAMALLQDQGGAELGRKLWRTADLTPALEKRLLKRFGAALTHEDHLYRAGRMWLRDQKAAASRAAVLSGKSGEAVLHAAADIAGGAASSKAAAKIAESDRNDPILLFARVHALRKAEKITEASKLLRAVPRDAEARSGDDWWIERRLLSRKFLDAKDFRGAYEIAAAHAASGDEARLEAEFHAGWIALRFLDDPALAAPHFDAMAKIARTPSSIARAAYWRGRVEEARGGDARPLFARAAGESETYYGQLARARFGEEPLALAIPLEPPVGEARAEPVRAAELLFAIGEKDAARQLALEASASLPAEQMAALAKILDAQVDPNLALLAGKSALSRGVKLPTLAWPTNGAPDFRPLAEKSAPRATVLAIARQESAFKATARSGVGAMGLMQMMEPTARGAAKRAGITYDEGKLRGDATFSAQLGAFHLGELLAEYKGSHILAFAAYNAGGGNVAQWMSAYGDPRADNVDPVDWVERIPFTETRNYVQRVVENLHMYRALLGERAHLYSADLRQKVASSQ
ncbi:transglycosylase SLT domain-containing protein [Rhodoblastus acidophilus]|uniref:Transglycosylase SLT domain-containing protein n=1 Tax=Rhodoblastus acidophilus TaxID=1074 RepID=A0A6N8DLX1_RHOAC|nr:lytic transglycosylase domain-containing protein [Rhodoblastus acidophilus]MCW2273991.1 soluble lytic murein transglycosylase [Rhodoblastus acidophilus]MTV30866.1 transglycosylase SLT domain-containing protein [Rhodoblastus acidophilus]